MDYQLSIRQKVAPTTGPEKPIRPKIRTARLHIGMTTVCGLFLENELSKTKEL